MTYRRAGTDGMEGSGEVNAEGVAICCADIGSIKNDNFGWAVVHGDRHGGGKAIGGLVEEVVGSLAAGVKVALGFECPLWVPVTDDPSGLTAGRAVDGNRAWSAGPGPSVLATGLTETAWILRETRRGLEEQGASLPPAYLDWDEFTGATTGIFLWEAFVTGKRSPETRARMVTRPTRGSLARSSRRACRTRRRRASTSRRMRCGR